MALFLTVLKAFIEHNVKQINTVITQQYLNRFFRKMNHQWGMCPSQSFEFETKKLCVIVDLLTARMCRVCCAGGVVKVISFWSLHVYVLCVLVKDKFQQIAQIHSLGELDTEKLTYTLKTEIVCLNVGIGYVCDTWSRNVTELAGYLFHLSLNRLLIHSTVMFEHR